MALIGRLGLRISVSDWLFVLCFVDDLHLAVGGGTRWLTLWPFLVVMEMVNFPFSYHKFREVFQSDYVGFWMDYSRFEIGLSERRATWLVDFIKEMEHNDWLVNVKSFQEFHDRLGFLAQVLPWLRALLSPGYAVGKAATLWVPELLALSCIFIKEKFAKGLRKIPCGLKELELGELFKTDAKCEPTHPPCFSLTLTPTETPWLFRGPEVHQLNCWDPLLP